MEHEYEIGDYADLIKPAKGCRHVEIIGFDGLLLRVRTESGREFSVWEDELEEK